VQLSVRGFDKALERRVRALARREGISLNQAALLLLRRGAGLVESPESASSVGHALDRFVGRWSPKDEEKFLGNIRSLERVDETVAAIADCRLQTED
jgi:hypothetical protein